MPGRKGTVPDYANPNQMWSLPDHTAKDDYPVGLLLHHGTRRSLLAERLVRC